jgi:hypothetical protein
MTIRISAWVGLLAALVATVCAQEAGSRAEAARRAVETRQAVVRVDEAVETSEVDLDLGRQTVIAAGGLGLYGGAESGLYYTSNPSLNSGGGRGDMYFYARGTAGIYRNLTSQLAVDASVSEDVFQYATFSSLNFSRFQVRTGLDYYFPSIELLVSARYTFQRYFDGGSLDAFYTTNTLDFGLSREVTIGDRHAVEVRAGTSLAVDAQPAIARRNRYDVGVGWRWRLVDSVELQSYYLLSMYQFPNESNRFDVTNSLGSRLIVSLTRWAFLTVSADYAVNASTQSVFNYSVATLGGSALVDLRF